MLDTGYWIKTKNDAGQKTAPQGAVFYWKPILGALKRNIFSA
jgi:hypothetical protein